ncbi:hypothetical protein [Paraburkholderia sp. UYCP14C]|uniref:hypothetical protein n=1 Tax=Paraburkholderia sp. UYCP14C TaxID=2511130 RepID=UPI0010A95D1A|nr:hypothetical protein [Paraburkholderia sp. UYCP14C]
MHAIARETDIMAEIAAISSEQSRGIEQVNLAITQMDKIAQKNAVLVKQVAATRAVENQGQRVFEVAALVKVVGVECEGWLAFTGSGAAAASATATVTVTATAQSFR